MFPVIVFYFVFIVSSSVLGTQVKRSWDTSAWSNYCVLPPCPEHATYEVTDVFESWHGERWPTVVEFTCWPGYTLVGSRVIECYDGRWSDQTPQCVVDTHVFLQQNYHQQQLLPQHQQFETQQQQFAPQSQQFAPQSQLDAPQSQQFAPPPQLDAPQSQQFAPQSQQISPQSQLDALQSQQFAPQSQLDAPQSQPIAPQSQLDALQSQQFAPQPQLDAPQSQQIAPQSQLDAPQSQLDALQSQQIAPPPQQYAPQPPEFVSQQQQLVPQALTNKTQQQQPILQSQQMEQPKTTTNLPESDCKLPPYPTNGSYELTEMMSTSSSSKNMSSSVELQFTCKSGSRLVGASAVACFEGRWSDSFPVCVFTSSESTPKEEQPVTNRTQTGGSCYLPSYPLNTRYESADANKDNVSPGDVLESIALRFTCLRGYSLVGAKIVNCTQGRWSDKFPRCKGGWDKVISKTNDSIDSSKDRTDVCESCPRSCMLQTFAGFSSSSNRGGPNLIAECGVLQVSRRYSHIPVGVAGGRPALGGWRVIGSELPWHVGIYDKSSTPFTQICGGSIISNNLIVSAAHCFWDDLEKLLPASQYAVGAGKRYRLWDETKDANAQKSDVKEIKIPPRYQHSMTNFQEDIALVTVLSDFTFDAYVLPVCLDFNFQLDVKQLQAGNLGKVGGWGLTAENGKPAPVLQIVEMPYVGIETCIAGNEPGFLSYLTGDKLCAGYKNGTALCKGDSGGGLAYPEDENSTKRYYLRGVVSSAPISPNDCNVYAWATFTHVLRHEHFITPLLTS